ncbi:plexin-A4 isoform X1, partial [Tachysurus ichikawai]
LLSIDDNFCGLDMNAPLGVSEMVRGIPLFTESNDKMTSVIAYVYKNHSLAYVGTKSGRLKKLWPRRISGPAVHGVVEKTALKAAKTGNRERAKGRERVGYEQ